ncbi:MFS transporter [Alloacidobacterium sp.]|uniref:MFS transporter n=1 Tax=Alloacidobacterium sp. TaxID=2951999 RepID=UPI002D35E7E1|nr:MFS transporter [Alloacidobacterium sp.]HYK36430.1 MFS transporter [Alloacidobacterium sp.]
MAEETVQTEVNPELEADLVLELPVAGTRWPPIARALRNHDYRLFWSGCLVSNIGTWMQNVAQGWLVLELSNSSFWLGMVGFAASFPFLLFTLFGGVIADRVSKRHLLIGTQSAQMIFAFVLAGLTYFKIITIGQLALLAFLTGVSNALNAPAYQALVPRLVPPEDLQNAIALNSAQFNTSRIVGPTLGGYAMAYFGMTGNFLLNGFSFLAVLWPLHRMRYPEEKRERHASVLRSLHEGIVYVRRSPEMSAIVMLIASASLFLLPFITFIPYFAKDVLNAGERGLGFLMACSGIGALTAAGMIAALPRIRWRGRVIVFCGLFVMTAVIVFSYSRIFALSSAMSFCEGFGMVTSLSTVNVTMQQLSSDEMRGRVMSIYATSFLGLPPVGCLIIGVLSRHMAAEHAIAAMTGLAMVCYLGFYMRSKALRELD